MKRPNSKITGPTYLTIARMILSVLFLIFVLMPDVWAKILALTMFILGAISDKIDGKWARRQHLTTDLGAFLDPLADKMLVNLAFLALVAMDVIPIWVFAVILIRDFAVDGIRMMAAQRGMTIAASFWGKFKTTLQMTAIIVMLLNLVVEVDFLTIVGNIALYAALALTIISGGIYLAKGWSKL